jgi:putative tricarboxylic transport membrane protein
MTILLGGFLLLGLDPGPDFLETHMDLAVGLALVLAAANLLAVVVMLALAPGLAKITLIKGHVLAPVLLALVVLGAYSANNNAMDVLFVFVFGALGYFLKELNYSRPALLLGFVLGPLIETYLHISLQAYGPWFFMRPISLAIALLIVFGMLWPFLRRRAPARAPGEER